MGEAEKEEVGTGLRSLLHVAHFDVYTVRDMLFVLAAVNILRLLIRTVSHELVLFSSLICRLPRLPLTRHGPNPSRRPRTRAFARALSQSASQDSAVVRHPIY